jgi:hypothetical protein
MIPQKVRRRGPNISLPEIDYGHKTLRIKAKRKTNIKNKKTNKNFNT